MAKGCFDFVSNDFGVRSMLFRRFFREINAFISND